MSSLVPTIDESLSSRECSECGNHYDELIWQREMFPQMPFRCDACDDLLTEKNQQDARKKQAHDAWVACVPPEYRSTSEDHPDYPRQVSQLAKLWLANHGSASSGLCLGMIGESGIGKTRVMARLIRLLIWRGERVMWVHGGKLQEAFQNQFDDAKRAASLETINRANRIPWLMIDDIGAIRGSECVTEGLGILMEERTANGRPILWTSNETLEEMLPAAQPKPRARIVSRLGGYSKIIEFSGK
jgi:DNA replication protein DnaC